MDKSYYEIYEILESYHDKWLIPQNIRSIFRMHDINYLTLMIYDYISSNQIESKATHQNMRNNKQSCSNP